MIPKIPQLWNLPPNEARIARHNQIEGDPPPSASNTGGENKAFSYSCEGPHAAWKFLQRKTVVGSLSTSRNVGGLRPRIGACMVLFIHAPAQ